MAGPQARKKASVADEQKKVIQDLNKAASVKDNVKLAGNTVRMWEVLQIVRESKKGAVYSAALSTLGGFGKPDAQKAAAIKKLQAAIVTSIKNLSKSVKSSKDVGKHEKPLANILNLIQERSMQLTWPTYRPFRSITRSGIVSKLLSNVRATEPARAPPKYALKKIYVKLAKPGVSPLSMRQPRSFFDFGQVHYFASKAGTQYFAVQGDPSALQNRSFANETDTRQFLGALGYALAAQLNRLPQNVGCNELLEAMGKMTNPQISGDNRWTQAMNFLRQGKRDQALDLLKAINPLYDTFWSTADHQIVATISNRAVSIFTAKATVIVDVFGSEKEFQRFLKSDRKKMGRAVVSLALGVSADVLRGGGTIKELVGGVQTGATKRVTGKGVAVAIPVGFTVSTSTGSLPTRYTIHTSFGYRSFKLDKTIQTISAKGEPTTKEVKEEGAYMGVIGFDVEFPSRKGRTPKYRVKFKRVGVGILGGALGKSGTSTGIDPRNVYAYATLQFDLHKKGSMRMQTFLTPSYAGMMNVLIGEGGTTKSRYEPRPGLQINPFTFTKLYRNSMLQVDPSAKIEYNTATRVWTIDAGAALKYRPHPAVELSAKLGYVVDTGGEKEFRLPGEVGPGYLTALIGLRWTPGVSKTPVAIKMKGRPVKVKLETNLNKKLKLAYQFMRAYPNQLKSAKAKSMAKGLAGTIESALIMAGTEEAGKIRRGEDYKAGIKALKAGNLAKGLALLEAVPGLFR